MASGVQSTNEQILMFNLGHFFVQKSFSSIIQVSDTVVCWWQCGTLQRSQEMWSMLKTVIKKSWLHNVCKYCGNSSPYLVKRVRYSLSSFVHLLCTCDLYSVKHYI